jgi:O-antigen ligase
MFNLAHLTYWIVFFLPLCFIQISFLEKGTLNFLDIILIFFLFFFFYFLLKEKRGKYFKKFLRRDKRLLIPLAIITVGFSLSYLINFRESHWEDGLGIIKSFLILPVLFAIAIKFLIQEGEISFQKICRSYFLASSFLALGGILYFLLGNTTYDNRLAIFSSSPNHLAMFLSPGLLMGIWFLKKTKKINFFKLSTLILLLSLFVQIVAIFLTKSLGSWIGLGFALFFLFWPIKKIITRRKIGFPLIVFFSALFFTFIAFSQILNQKIDYSPFSNQSSFDSRLVIYQVGIKIAANKWIWGIGPGNFQEIYLDYQRWFPPYPQWSVPHSHNLLLGFLLEAGILGFIGFCLLFWNFKKSLFKNKDPLIIIVGTLTVYFLIHGLVDFPLWKNDLAVIFWLVIILNFTNFKNKKEVA